jgi:hypothetical protein
MPNVSRAFGGPTESLIGYAQAARSQGLTVHIAPVGQWGASGRSEGELNTLFGRRSPAARLRSVDQRSARHEKRDAPRQSFPNAAVVQHALDECR